MIPGGPTSRAWFSIFFRAGRSGSGEGSTGDDPGEKPRVRLALLLGIVLLFWLWQFAPVIFGRER